MDAELARAQDNFERLLQVLAEHPGAGVAAVGADGVFRPVPDSVPMAGHHQIEARSVFELVSPAAMGTVLDGWQKVKEYGRSIGTIEAADGSEATIYSFDVKELVGSAILIVVGGALVDVADDAPELPVRSRFGRFRRDILAAIVDVDEEATGLLGWTLDSLAEITPSDLIHPDDQENALANWMKVLGAPGTPQRWRGRHQRHDGSYVWLEITNTNRLDDPDHGDVLSEMMDVSEEMATAEALRKREELLRRLTEALPVGVVQITAGGRIEHRNDQLLRITGQAAATNLDEQFADVDDEDRPRLQDAVASCLVDGTSSSLEVRLHPGGSYQQRVCQLTLRALHGADHTVEGAVVCVSDVTESTRMRQELEVRATFDPLTACYNRASTMAALERALDAPARPGFGTAVIFVDLDGFKGVNDTLGHAAGDELLVTVSSRLRSAVRGDDVVGRFGGDEFLVVCPSVTGPEEAMEIADRLAVGVRAPMELAGESVRPGASTGVAWAAPGEATPDSLVAAADVAMYRSKRDGGCVPTLAER